MAKRGVKPGTKRVAYKEKTAQEKATLKAKRVEVAEELLPLYLEPEHKWTREWTSPEMLQKVYLSSFAGLTPQLAVRILLAPEKEILEALKAIPEVKAHWDLGQQEIVTLCHVALTQRIRGMTLSETREKKWKDDSGSWKVEITTVKKEIPPDTDAVKFFLQNRIEQYQENNNSGVLENKVDTMLSRMEQMDLFER